MALTKVGKEGITGISNSSDATFLTATSAEGVTLAGTLAVTGVHTVGTNAVATSEGGAATSIINQGLCKCWAQLDGTGTIAIADSFNIGSATDQGTGDYSLTITNDMANLDWFGSIMDYRNRATTPGFNFDATTAVGAVRWSTYDSSAQDLDPTGIAIWGDLA
tara:strand:+ start:13 stop:501 length:489 start_codon:yes stop_codon:yes gene_type:complete